MSDKRKTSRTRYPGIEERVGKHGRTYRIRYRTVDGQRTESFRTLAEARDTLALRRTRPNVESRSGKEPFADFWTRYLADAETLGRPRASTLAKYEQVRRVHVEPVLGKKKLVEIRRADVQALVRSVATKSPWQATEALRLVRLLLYRAVEDGALLVNPAARITPPRLERRRPRVLTPEELSRLVEATTDRYQALVLLNAGGAFRWSELIALQPEDVDWLRRTVRVERTLVEVKGRIVAEEPKTKQARRTIDLPESVVQTLAHHVEVFPPKETPFGTLLFTSEGGHPISRRNFRSRVWKPAVSKAGLQPSGCREDPPPTPHWGVSRARSGREPERCGRTIGAHKYPHGR